MSKFEDHKDLDLQPSAATSRFERLLVQSIWDSAQSHAAHYWEQCKSRQDSVLAVSGVSISLLGNDNNQCKAYET